MTKTKILLASASPRRRQLLGLLNIPFETTKTDLDETPIPGEAAPDLVRRLSRLKAKAAQAIHTDCVVIAADTDVELDGEILGKPMDPEEARLMLRALRGREHRVYGGITIIPPAAEMGERIEHGVETLVTETRVWMRDYTDAELESYVATGDPLDKAAGYAVQHLGFRPVARVEGCYSNIMGLALCQLWQSLSQIESMPDPCLQCHLHPGLDCTVPFLVAEGAVRGS